MYEISVIRPECGFSITEQCFTPRDAVSKMELELARWV
jgi:hypothetical protein